MLGPANTLLESLAEGKQRTFFNTTNHDHELQVTSRWRQRWRQPRRISVVNGNFPPFPSHLEATDLAQCESNLDQTAVQQKSDNDAPEIVKQLKDLIGKFSVKYRGAQLWNSLPDNLRNQKSNSSFKNLIKIYIQHNLHLD